MSTASRRLHVEAFSSFSFFGVAFFWGSRVKPYYDEGGITIYHGDCREVLPELKPADVVLTDPPYGVGLGYGEQFKDTPEYVEQLILEALPAMRAAAPIVALTCGIGNLWRYPPPTWALCWYQTNAMSVSGKWGFNVWQPLLVYGPDPYLKRGLGRRPDLIATAAPSTGGRDQALTRGNHPCPKPFESWIKLLLRVSPAEGEVIIDPFMGSGTTLAAAKYSGRRAIGIEIEERYCEIAVKRLGQEVFDFGEAA